MLSSANVASRFLFVLRSHNFMLNIGMNDLTLFEHPQFGKIRVVMDVSNEPLFCLSDLCEALDLRSPDVRKRLKDDVVSTHIAKDSLGRNNSISFVNERGMYRVIFQSRKKEAEAFQDWVYDEVLPSIRKTGKYELPNQEDKHAVTKENVECRLMLVDAYERLLHINASSKAMMLNSIAQDLGHPLLDYVPSKGTLHSATYLLKANGIGMSARTFNKLMVEKGFLEEKTRPSKKGEKRFYAITETGLEYGENQTSPQNPKETQPCWYDNTFSDLVR